jgi:wyosine [tRNA(Phe)-imidazoG37] synthetase (radical SAM superfamily)
MIVGSRLLIQIVKNAVSSDLKTGGLRGAGTAPALLTHEAAFGYPRDFLSNHFVYLVISPRANGLSIGVNLNPVPNCNLYCAYCEVERGLLFDAMPFDIDRMTKELGETIELVEGGWLRQWPRYSRLPSELLQLRHVALSGEGEPTLSRDFVAATRAVAALRKNRRHFKIVLLTNSTALDQPQAQEGLALLSPQDEIWAKLDGGTQEYVSRVNGPATSLAKILDNILLVGSHRPVIVQSLFPALNGEEPPGHEIEEYALRLRELKQAGAQIPLVQIYSITRPTARAGCSHLPLRTLSHIAQRVRQVAGLRAEVY